MNFIAAPAASLPENNLADTTIISDKESSNIKTVVANVKNNRAKGLVFLDSQESETISEFHLLEISCISTISISNSFKAVSLSSGVSL